MNIWVILLNIGVIGLLAYGTWLLYVYIEKKGWIVNAIHPYTNKKSYVYYWEFLRILLLVIMVVVFLFLQSWTVVFVGIAVAIIYTYTVMKKNKKEQQEIVIASWEYDKEQLKTWKDWIIENRENKEKKNKKIVKQVSKKVVITSKYIYFSKRKRISIVKDEFAYLKIDKIEIKGNMLVLTYNYLMVPVRIYGVLIGTEEKNKFSKDLLNSGIICYNEGKK